MEQQFNKFELVYCNHQNSFGFVVSDKMDIPYIHDGCGCANAEVAPKFEKPEEWDSFEGYLVLLMPSDKYIVCAHHGMRKVDLVSDTSGAQWDLCSLRDHATSGLRYHLGLMRLVAKADKRYLANSPMLDAHPEQLKD